MLKNHIISKSFILCFSLISLYLQGCNSGFNEETNSQNRITQSENLNSTEQEENLNSTEQEIKDFEGFLSARGGWTVPEGSLCEFASADALVRTGDANTTDDIAELGVVIKNSGSVVIGMGSLEYPPTLVNGNCSYRLTAKKIPISDFYTISVGDFIEETITKEESTNFVIYTDEETLKRSLGYSQ